MLGDMLLVEGILRVVGMLLVMGSAVAKVMFLIWCLCGVIL
jgi:hypothetical protein